MTMKKIGMVVAVEIQSVMRKYADKLKREDVRGFKFIRLHLMIKF